MTKDSSKERASLDSILQTCDSLHSDNEMTSRERCQALLWECQATKDLHKQNVDKKAIEESEKTKAQHAILMGSVCVAANVKGFLKQSRSPAEAKNVQDTNSGEIQNKSLEKEPERKSTIEQEIDYNKGKQPNARDPSPAAGSLFSHYRNLTDTSMMFSPISGNPKPNHQSSFPGGQSQTSTPTFVPIAVPVPTAGPPPMWYMTPSGMVPFGPMGHHPGYFVPVNQGSGSYVVSDEVTSKDIERNSRPSTPKSETSQGSSVSKTTRDVTASTKSKIPRPIRDPNRRSPRPPNSHQRRDEPRSIPTTRPSEEPQVRGSKNDETYTSPKTESSPSSHEPGGTTTSLYRSHTPPVRLRSGSVELERQNLRRPRPRSSTGSLVSAPSSGERVSRPSSPVTHSKRNEKSRPSSPCFSEGRSGSRPSSPLSSRSSSPVAALISRFEDLSTEKQASEYSQSVSNLLSKFGSSSLLPEDRLTKKHFKTNVPQTREHNYYGRSGPFRPTSAADHLSNKWHSETNESLSKSWQAKPTQRQPNQSDASSLNRDDSPLSRNLPNKAETIGKTRNRSASSLENLHGVPYWEDKRQSTEQYSMRKNRERSWSSMENLHKASYEEQVKGYRIKKFSSAENLSQGSTEVDVGSKDHGVSSITSQGLRKSLTENSYNDFSYASGKGMAKNEPKLVRPLPLERTSAHSQELNVGIRETAGGSILKSTVMKAERDYQQDYTKEAVSSSTRSRFEIPVALAVMDSERESMGSSAFIPSLFSPSSAVKDKVFFQYPIKLEKESAPLSPPVPLSPSLKDCRPTSYFSSLSFTDLAMNPEKDTSNDGNKKSDAGHPPRATSYQVNSDSVPIGHQDKPDMIELVGTNSNVKKLNFNKDREKGKSSRNSSLNAHDYLERFQKRLTKTNSLENIRQDMEELISSLSRNNSKPKNFEGNAPSKSHLVMKESLGKLPNDSSGNSLEKAKKVHQEKGTLGSLVSQNLRASRNFQTETQSKQINKERSPSETGAQGKSASNKTQQTSKSGIEYSSAPCKLPSVTNPQGTEPPKPLPNKPSSVPNTPISGNSKYSNFFSYARRQSSPNIGSSAEKLHSRRSLLDIHNEKSGEHDDSSSSNHHERKIKESSKPKSPAPSTNHQATGRHQPSITAEQSAFDFPEKIFMEKGAGGAFANKQLNRNIRHKEVVKTQSNPLSVEHILSNETQITDARTDSSDLTSSKLENTRPLILRSPTSPTSSSNSNSSSPSPRLPLNKSMFYFPSSERAEKQLSPTEHLDSSGQKGFVITDTSRQRSKNTDSSDYRVPHKASSSDTEMEEQTMKTLEKSSLEHPSGLAAELHEIKYLKSGDKSLTSKKVTEPANTADNINIVLEKKEFAGSGEPSSITAQPNKYNHSNMNLEHRDKTKQEQGIEKKSEKSLHRTLHYSGSSEEVKQSPTSKERNTTSVGEGEVSGGRRRSIDLRQIYNSAQRASLTPRLDTTSPKSSSSHSTTSRPNSALDKRPPSPNRLDSKELLGHFVKKVLNSANTTKSSNSSPSSSFAEGTCTQSRESSKTDILGIYVLSPREREKSSENRNKERKESLERKQEGETKEIKMNPKGNQQLERKASNEMEQRHDDQARTDAARERKERNVSHQRVEQYGDQGKIDATKDRKGSHERKEQHGDQKRINATRERKASHEKERHHDNQDTNDSARGRKNPYERKQKYEGLERIDAKIDIMTSDKTEYQAERGEAVELKRRLSHETDKQPLPHRIEEIPLLALNKEALQTQQESLDTPRETDDVLNKLVDMIHDEFAFDGYLDDGVEDVNMGEYVMSLTGMSEDMFKESVRDQYSDLYWDGDLLQDMYILVNKKLTSRKPTLRFSESIASDVSRPGSSQSMESNPETSQLATRSVSRTSSERSFHETRDYLMSSLGEPTQFLPFKMICPEITRDIIDELGPVFEDYQKEMKIKLAPSISELMEKLGAKILEIGQQLTLERRAKKKNIASFNKVADIDHKKDVKDLVSKLLQEIEESDKKIIYLKYIQRRLRNIYAERFGLDHSLLYSFVNSYSITNVSLEPKRQNNLLIFSPLWDQRSNQSSEAHGESTRGPVLQYGTTQGMLSYLFARHSMSQAFVRFFLYTFRYCATPDELFVFILDKCRASLRAETGSDKTYNHQLQIRYRGLDLLAEWTNCCFQFDFKTDPRLLQSLFAFLQQELIPVDKTDRGKMLVELITEKQRKDMEEHVEETSDTLAVLQTEDSQGSILEKDSPRKFPIKRKKSPVQCFKRGSPQASSMYKATVYLKAMSVIDHSSRTIAEQLTLIQQDVFARVHSIHFLNSRTLGIGVGRLSPTKETSQLDSMLGFSAGRRRSITSDTLNQSDSSSSPSPRTSGESNLFICQPVVDGCLEALLMHAQDVSMWVAVEICSAPSIKNQLVLIQKYISIAKYCAEMRNFATSVQIVDALEMFVIRQLPVWKQVPNKVIQTLEELKAIKVLLKTDSSWLLKNNAYREKPTIPCALLFLMHIQQLELGGFTLANGMYKWTKMRSIARLVDQIRLFKQMRYAFESSDALKDRLRMRIQECREENLHALAAENAANFHLSSSQSSRKFQEAFKKMKATFGNG